MNEVKIFFKNKYYRSKFKLIFLLPMTILLILVDLISKIIVQTRMEEYQAAKFIDWLFNFRYILNKGGAGGFFDHMPWLIITSALITTILLIIAFIMVNDTKLLIPLLFVIAGSAGNLIGRIWGPEGAVVDFIELGSFSKQIVFWAPNGIFNIADLLVNIGIIIMVFILVVYVVISIYEIMLKKDEAVFNKYLERENKLFIAKKEFENSKGYCFKPEIKYSTYKANIKQIKKDFIDFKNQNKHASN